MFHLAEFWYGIAAGQDISIQGALDEIFSDGSVLFLLFAQGEEHVASRTADPGRLDRAEAFAEDYQWTLAPASYFPSPDELRLSSPDYQQSFSFNPHNALVELRQGNQSFWFTVQPKADGPSIYDFVYAWYESAA